MPRKQINGVELNFEILGSDGPWIVLTPGGRQNLSAVRALGARLANEGFSVLLHDRRNCGASDVKIAGEESEQVIWANDLHALLVALGALPVIAGGGSAGCRLSLLLASQFPDAVRGLLLWWVTGGPVAAQHLGHAYYGQFIDAARAGGMAAVCRADYFAERIKQKPANRDYLLQLDVEEFIETMSRWQTFFTEGATLPVIGATEATLSAIRVPTCIVPGNDPVHPRERGDLLHRLLDDSELHTIRTDEEFAAVVQRDPTEVARETAGRLGNIFSDFLARRLPI